MFNVAFDIPDCRQAGILHQFNAAPRSKPDLSGTFVYAPEGGQEQMLGPGSYLFVRGGLKHTSGVGGTEPCEVFQTSGGKFDFVPAEKPKM